jgi:hypothetical protein
MAFSGADTFRAEKTRQTKDWSFDPDSIGTPL